MKIAICSTGEDEYSKVDERFARCDYFVIYDHDILSFYSIENIAKDLFDQAGIVSTLQLQKEAVTHVLLPKIGSIAHNKLSQYQIESYVYQKECTVRDNLYLFFEKKLHKLKNA